MALIEKFYVIAAEHTVGSTDIAEGQVVIINSSGEIVPYAGSGTPLGLAGDTQSSSSASMPGVASGWQNRVPDMFDETSASGKMTVYHSGGEFATDKFETDVASANVGSLLYPSASGTLQATDPGGDVAAIAILTLGAAAYPSGVPGVDVNGDMALTGDNSNTYIEFKLLI